MPPKVEKSRLYWDATQTINLQKPPNTKRCPNYQAPNTDDEKKRLPEEKIESAAAYKYIEDLGTARIDKGIFCLQINIDKNKMERNLDDISNTIIGQFRQLCTKTTRISGETQCSTLVKHLVEKK